MKPYNIDKLQVELSMKLLYRIDVDGFEVFYY